MNTQRCWLARLLLFLVATYVMSGAAVIARADEGDSLGALWWQHALSFPTSQNPILDETGERCMLGQRGDTWFLHGSFGNPLGAPIERNCTIPTGKRIYLPIVNFVCTLASGETVRDIVRQCRDIVDLADLTALEVDGQVSNDLIKRRRQTTAFDITLPADNIIGVPAGSYIAVHDGYFALLPELGEGLHTIHLQGGISALGFTVDVIYNITVVVPSPF